MPYDPNVPVTNAELTSAMLRGQFTGLKTLIDAVPGLTNVVIDSVTTLPAGSSATADAVMNGTVLHLSLGIPSGNDGPPGATGSSGSNGNDGAQGQQGEPGPPGEVTQVALTTAISGTAMNPTSISPLNLSVNDPPTQNDVQQVVNWGNSLLAALFRTP